MISFEYGIYYILLLMSIVLWYFFRLLKIDDDKIYTIFMYGFLWVLSAFRGDCVGADTYEYINSYQYLSNMELQGFYIHSFEIGYVILNKILYIISNNPQLLLITTSFIIIAGFGMFFYKYSPNVYLSTVLFIGLYFYTYTFTAIRQWISVAILCWAMSFLWQGDRWRSLLLILLAICFHSTAIVFVLFVITGPLNKKKMILLVVAVAFLYIILHDFGMSILSGVFGENEKFLNYLGGRFDVSTSYGVGLLKVLLWWGVGILLLIFKAHKLNSSRIYYLFICEIYAGFFLLMGYDVSIISRVAFDYMVFICIAIPEMYILLGKYKKIMLELLIFIGSFIYLTYSLNTDGGWAVYNFVKF